MIELSAILLDELLLFSAILVLLHVLIVDKMWLLELELSRTCLNVLRMIRMLSRLLHHGTMVTIAVRALKVLLFLRVIRKLIARVCVRALFVIILLLLQ